MKKFFLLAFKIFAGCYLFYYLAFKFSWSELPDILSKIDVRVFLLAVLVYTLKYLVDAYRWFVANSIVGVNIPFRFLLKFKFVGPAFDFLTPLPQGEDVYKFFVLRKFAANLPLAIGVPVFIRFTGLLSVATFLPATIFHYRHYFPQHNYLSYPLVVLIAVVLVLIVGYVVVLERTKRSVSSKLNLAIEKVRKGVNIFFAQWKLLIVLFVLGICSHLTYVFFVWLLIIAMGIDFSIWTILLTLPLIYFAAVIPTVAGGLGLKEGVVMWLLTFHSVSMASAQAVALIHLLVLVSFVVVGFVLYLTMKEE